MHVRKIWGLTYILKTQESANKLLIEYKYYLIRITQIHFLFFERSEHQKRMLRKESGVTEKGGAFDVLKSFSGL